MAVIDVAASLLRGLHVAALVSLFGTLLFMLFVLPSTPAAEVLRTRQWLAHLARFSAACGFVLGIAWLVTETAIIAGADSVTSAFHAVPIVALRTQFGHWLLLRLVLLSMVLVTPRLRGMTLIVALGLAGGALGVQPMLGHAGAIGGGTGSELIASEVLHLLAAGAWLGGLLPLFIATGLLPGESAATACRNFTPIGLSAVLILAGTAVVQIAELMGGLPGLFGTDYGHIALIKLGLFFVLLALAALNRLILTERLTEPGPNATRHMRTSIAIEMVLGALVVIIAAFLASRTPGTHEEPVWPFPWRPSLTAFDDPDLRGELVGGLIGVATAAALGVLGLVWRRARWLALGAAVVLLALSIPHLDLLFVAAYPTSFFTSPTEFAATAIAHGARLFAANCTACHGTDARGDGPAAPSLPVRPADLTADHFRAHADGELYWFIANGFRTPEGVVEMPGFTGTLSSEAIWDLIDYLHAHNAGDAMQRTGQWPVPVAMPQFDARCPNGQDIDLDDLRGRPLLIVAGNSQQSAIIDAVTIVVMRNPGEAPTVAACTASEPQVWTALAIILGLSPDALTGTEMLVDPSGWLRASWRPGEPGNWTDPAVLSAKLRDLVAHPLVVKGAAPHRHSS